MRRYLDESTTITGKVTVKCEISTHLGENKRNFGERLGELWRNMENEMI